MKIIAIFGLVSLLTACGPKTEPIPQKVCDGKLEKVTGMHLRMTCDNGKVIDYTSYKYNMTEK